MNGFPSFLLPPGSHLAAGVGPEWTFLPLRIPGGWAIHHNGLAVRKLPSGRFEMNNCKDLFWAIKLPPSKPKPYPLDLNSICMEIHVDAGWYMDRFRLTMLEVRWDSFRASYETQDLEDFVRKLEEWLLDTVRTGGLRGR